MPALGVALSIIPTLQLYQEKEPTAVLCEVTVSELQSDPLLVFSPIAHSNVFRKLRLMPNEMECIDSIYW